MNNFKFSFFLAGQLGSLSIDNFFLINCTFKMLPSYEYFCGNFIFALLLERSAEIVFSITMFAANDRWQPRDFLVFAISTEGESVWVVSY